MARFEHTNEKVEDIYITKYWESRGVLRARATTYTSEGREYADVRLAHGGMFLPEKSWARTYREACDQVVYRATNRANALKKALDRANKTLGGAKTYDLTVEVLETGGSSR